MTTGIIILLAFAAITLVALGYWFLVALGYWSYQKIGLRLLERRIYRSLVNATIEVSEPEAVVQPAPNFYVTARQEAEDAFRGTHSLR